MFTVEFLKKQKLEAMKTKNKAISNVVSGVLGDLQTKQTSEDGLVMAKKNAEGKNELMSVSAEEYVEYLLSKLVGSLTEAIKIYEKRGDTARKEQSSAELAYIQEVFFPPLSAQFIKEKADAFKAEGKNKGQFMTYMKENYNGRYNGAEVAKAF